ncbi:MAG: metallophosphoesterase family protein [Fibrobacter sp.]|jgi:predicted phosphodiesterase|nr:metallophosphoesterase family protein [Fibrobacter sp.]
MRFAFISDIHANLEALEAVLKDIDGQSIDEVICLGDIVGYGANPNECVEIVNKRCPVTLLGNHDAAAVDLLSTQHFNIHAKIAIEWTSRNLKKESRQFLRSQPYKHQKLQMTLVHATPYEPNMWYYITSLEEAAFNFQFFDSQLCFIGHTHIPLIIVLDKNNELYVHQDTSVCLHDVEGARLLINVGSVGQPRDRNPGSCYGIFDSEKGVFSYRRVTYNIEKAQAKMKKARMPEFLISRLEDGR